MKQYEIVTMSKAKFDKLSPAKKRMTIAQDVLDRIDLKQLKGISGNFIRNIGGSTHIPWDIRNLPMKEQLQDKRLKCEACAKGSLFMSFIGITNNYNESIGGIGCYNESTTEEMQMLSEIFSVEQLEMIEVAFEGIAFSGTDLSGELRDKCREYYSKNKSIGDTEILIKICKNIIKNKGTFKP